MSSSRPASGISREAPIAQLRPWAGAPPETDRPVHLNIRAEQNLLSLLQSIRYSQGIPSELEQDMRRHTPRSHPD